MYRSTRSTNFPVDLKMTKCTNVTQRRGGHLLHGQINMVETGILAALGIRS